MPTNLIRFARGSPSIDDLVEDIAPSVPDSTLDAASVNKNSCSLTLISKY